jgi:hypothetical protein
VPNLQGKRDLIPGYTTALWLQADRKGVFRGQCASSAGSARAHGARRRRRIRTTTSNAGSTAMRQTAEPSGRQRGGAATFSCTARCASLPHDARHRSRRPVAPDLTHVAIARHTWRRHPAEHTRAPRRAGFVIRKRTSRAIRCRRTRSADGPAGARSLTWRQLAMTRCSDDRQRREREARTRPGPTPTGFRRLVQPRRSQVHRRRYLVTAFGFFLLGGVLAALMRLQLARPTPRAWPGSLQPDLHARTARR